MMSLKNKIIHIKILESGTTKKSEIKEYQKFIRLLTSLEQRDWSTSEIQHIENKLDSLDLKATTSNQEKYVRKAFKLFQEYLKETFSLTVKGYYGSKGLVLGVAFGVIFGVVVLPNFERSLGISIGLALGMAIEMIIGHSLDAQAMASGKSI